MTVQTVLGPVDASELGHCQMHEHLFVSAGPATRKHPALLIDDEALSVVELCAYREAGGRSLLDAQPGGAGRNAQALRRMSEKSGVQIVCVTGYHLPMFYPEDSFIFSEDEDELMERFVGELHCGIADEPGAAPVRAGAVKAALGPEGCAGRMALQLRAAARAAAACDVPLVLHTERGIGASQAVALCAACGVPPRRVLVCHVDRQAEDFAPHEAAARTGALLEYDTIGRFKYHSEEAELALILHMIGRGCADRLLLSLDTTRERLRSYGGPVGLTHLLDSFLTRLRAAGVSDRDIFSMTTGNARRAFEGPQKER